MKKEKDIRWKQRFENYSKAYTSLLESDDALKKEPDNGFIKDSVIQRYEYTVELAWKVMKDYLEDQGFIDVTSPKKVIRKAFEEGIIKDASAWMAALNGRNITSHAYDETYYEIRANEIIKDISEKYILLFRDLFEQMNKENNV
jgi:nucleotidyltransferase substrate binding protein (TIGR01987 family)